MLFRLLRLVLVLAIVASAPLSLDAAAQGPEQGVSGVVVDQQKILQDLTTRTDTLEKKIQEDGDDDASLVDIRLQLEEMSRGALNSALAFRPRLSEINARLDQLGA
ncbi:MAG: mechanosensitive ion channel family protein, partial [Mesorhizobium sp.]